MAPITQTLAKASKILQGISTYADQTAISSNLALTSKQVEQIRSLLGGELQPIPQTQLRWYLADLEDAQRLADGGDLSKIGKLWRSVRRDGVAIGLFAVRTSGLVSLPIIWRGDKRVVADLEATSGTRSVFEEMFPPAELAMLHADGIFCGVGVGELIPVPGRDFPVFRRLDPEFLRFRWSEGRWYYHSVAGPIQITPGDGRWILHVPGGRLTPWQNGIWAAVGRAFIDKEHALMHRSNFSAKLANPARVASSALGASDEQRQGLISSLIQWGINNVFELPPGWKAEILESNGRGYEVFKEQISTSDNETILSIAGQIVTTTGGSGFANADIHRTILSTLVQRDGSSLAYTLNTQGLPFFALQRYGEESLQNPARLEWDTQPAKDLKAEADSLKSAADAIKSLRESLSSFDYFLEIDELIARYGIPARKMTASEKSERDNKALQETARLSTKPNVD